MGYDQLARLLAQAEDTGKAAQDPISPMNRFRVTWRPARALCFEHRLSKGRLPRSERRMEDRIVQSA
jgi:hypothetical protein